MAGKFNDTPASVTFTILRPFWQRWWFLLLLAVTIGFVAYGLHRYRLRQLLAVEQVRARLATDLHDDVGASLSQIAILSEVSRQSVGTESNGIRLEQIAATSHDALDAMSDIVWATNPQRDHV